MQLRMCILPNIANGNKLKASHLELHVVIALHENMYNDSPVQQYMYNIHQYSNTDHYNIEARATGQS